jgi:hypothetical protein
VNQLSEDNMCGRIVVILRSRIPVLAVCVSWRATAALARRGSNDRASVSSEGLGRPLMMQVPSVDFPSPIPVSGFPLKRASVGGDIGGCCDVMFPERSVATESVARYRFTIHDTGETLTAFRVRRTPRVDLANGSIPRI